MAEQQLHISRFRYSKDVVKRIRTAFRVCISLLAFSAYASAANHCVLAPAADKAAKTPSHEGCPGHDAPGEDGNSGKMQCCKEFPPVNLGASKNPIAFDSFSFTTHLYFATAVLAAEQSRAELHPLELDTGPPFAASFAESVLQRSILAHAPPLALS